MKWLVDITDVVDEETQGKRLLVGPVLELLTDLLNVDAAVLQAASRSCISVFTILHKRCEFPERPDNIHCRFSVGIQVDIFAFSKRDPRVVPACLPRHLLAFDHIRES